MWLLFLAVISAFQVLHAYQQPIQHARSSFALQATFLDIIKDKVTNKKVEPPKSEGDRLLGYVDYKPWRATKVKHLKIHYKSWKDTWQERLRSDTDDTIYIYSVPENRIALDHTRIDDIWCFPWLWTKIKAERLSYINKYYMQDVTKLTIQEHMEMDNFYSEFDMPLRWGILRLKELDTFNIFFLNFCYFFNLNGITPTDLGVRPDGTVRTCPVQFHNCLSSSNDPMDTEHYAPAFHWSRAKSPEQAFEEIKNVYEKYPKRGLRWTYGWIDRGGWRAADFSGTYFHAEANSLAFGFTDDIELVAFPDKREVQVRTASRLGQMDLNTNRLRYNHFVRMLKTKQGWDAEPLPMLNYEFTFPQRWTVTWMDKLFHATEAAVDGAKPGLTRDIVDGVYHQLVEPVEQEIEKLVEESGLTTQWNELSTVVNQQVESVKQSLAPVLEGKVKIEKTRPGDIFDDGQSGGGFEWRKLRFDVNDAVRQVQEKIEVFQQDQQQATPVAPVVEEQKQRVQQVDRAQWEQLLQQRREQRSPSTIDATQSSSSTISQRNKNSMQGVEDLFSSGNNNAKSYKSKLSVKVDPRAWS